MVFSLNSRQLQYAVLLAQVRNFSQVAEQLGITQPALSKQILNLESELGLKLFDRNHVPLTLTPAGEYFIQKAKDILAAEDQLQRTLEQFKTGENGRLTIGVTPFRSLYLMPDIVRQIKDRYPGVQVTLHEANTAQLRKDALEGKFDFAVINLPVDESVLDVIPLQPDTLVLTVPRKLAEEAGLTAGTELDFSDCRELPFVTVGPTQEMRQLFDRLCASAGFHPNIAAEVVGITTAWAMAQAGVGATLLPLQFVRNQTFRENLVFFPIGCSYSLRQPAIVTKRGQYLPDYAKYAIELFSTNQ